MSTKTYLQTAEALGTTLELRLVGSSKLVAEQYFAELWDYVAVFEKRFSRFQKDSEINKVNFGAGNKVQVSPEFIMLAKESLKLSELTNGRYNPFILPALQKAGYLRSMKTGGADLEPIDFTDRVVVDAERFVVDSDWVSIPENSALDFGGIGKGYLADRLNDLIGAEFSGHLFSIGGDINAGGYDETGSPWEVAVESSKDPQENIATYQNSNEENFAIATSGLFHVRAGTKQAHIINSSSTDVVDSEILTCTVLAKEAALADVFASCLLNENDDYVQDIIKAKYIQGALLQYKNGMVVDAAETFDVQYNHKRGYDA